MERELKKLNSRNKREASIRTFRKICKFQNSTRLYLVGKVSKQNSTISSTYGPVGKRFSTTFYHKGVYILDFFLVGFNQTLIFVQTRGQQLFKTSSNKRRTFFNYLPTGAKFVLIT